MILGKLSLNTMVVVKWLMGPQCVCQAVRCVGVLVA